MQITFTKQQADDNEERKRKANEGCDKCPCCGYKPENRVVIEEKHIGLFKTWVIDKYHCPKCDARWQSDRYYIEE